jgi:hypothetical protein
MYDIEALILSATEQSIFIISPTFNITFPSRTERVEPLGIGASLIIYAVVFCVCDVCVVVLTRVTLAVT